MQTLYRLYLGCIVLLAAWSASAAEKILIFTHTYNRPDFIELHKKTFDEFLEEEYEYVVFNDAPNDAMKNEIENTCRRLGVRCVRVPQELHQRPGRNTPGHRHMDGIQFSLDTLVYDYDGIALFIDSDMFLIKPFSVVKYLAGYDLIGGEQWRIGPNIRVTYIAPTLVFMNMRTLPNKRTISFEDGSIEGQACDVGGHTYYYLKNNPTLRYRLFIASSEGRLPRNANELRALGYDDNTIQFIMSLPLSYHGFEFHGDHNFMHYYAGGSNWPGYSAKFLQEKNALLYNFIDRSIAYYRK